MSATDAVQGLCEAIRARRGAALSQQGHNSAQHVPRASGIDRCARAMQFDVTHWQQRPQFDEHLLARLERGKAIESLIVIPELMRLGFQVVGGQTTLTIKDRAGRIVCTGHIDGVIEYNGARVVFDCKSMHPILWAKIRDGADGVDDLLADKFAYRYPWQLLLYMYAHEIEQGLFILDDCLGHWKFVWMSLMDHLPRCEEAIRQCEAVVSAIADGRELPYYDDAEHCQSCRWFSAGICSPPLDFSADGMRIVSDADLAASIAKRESLAEAATEYDTLDKLIKGRFKALGDGKYIAGDYVVEVHSKDWKAFQVAASVRQFVKVRPLAK